MRENRDSTYTKNKRYDIKVILLVALLALLNAYSKNYPVIGMVLGVGEVICLIFMIFMRTSLEKYLKIFFVFSATCMDTPLFVFGENSNRNLYSFVNLPLIHSYHILLFLFVPIISIIMTNRRFHSYIKQLKCNKDIFRFVKLFTYVYVGGIFIGLLNILIGDNHAWSHLGFYLDIFKHQFFLFSCYYFLVLDCSILYITNNNSSDHMINLFVNIFRSIAIASIASCLIGWSADLGSGTVLLLSQSSFFAAIILLLPLYDYGEVMDTLLGVVLIIVMSKKSSAFAGKWWLYIFLILLICAFKCVKMKRTIKVRQFIVRLLIIYVFIIAVFAFSVNIAQIGGYGLAQYKFNQAKELISVFSDNWYENVPASPKMRIDEFINIWIEFVEKPHYLLLGKGLSGTIIQHTNVLNWDLIGSTFSGKEIEYGLFAYVHETINILALSSGILGLCFVISEVRFFIKTVEKSCIEIVGFIWFAFFFGSSYLSLIIGLGCLFFAKANRSLLSATGKLSV